MQQPSRSHMDEEEEEADGYDSSSFKGEVAAKARGDGAYKALNPNRSKHSETEQRRRSKINERLFMSLTHSEADDVFDGLFQLMRDLIPQNEQKRDKASLLLEVIEYIQFLQEKLQVYEGSCQGLTQQPSKLPTWKNPHTTADSLADQSPAIKAGLAVQNALMIPDAHNSMESDLGSATAAIYKTIDHPCGSTTPTAPFTLQTQPCMYSSVGQGGVPAQSSQGSHLDADNTAYHLHSQAWQSQLCTSDNNGPNGREELMGEGGLASVSSAYSQGVLNTLIYALQSSGVDLSRASISVEIEAGKRAADGTTTDQGNLHLCDQVIGQSIGASCGEDPNQDHKRRRTNKS